MKKYKQIKILLFILMMATVGFVVYTSLQEGAMPGPLVVVTTPEGNFMVGLNDRIVTLDASGRMLNSTMLTSLGMQGSVEDMQVLSDGSILIGDRGFGKIFQCRAQLDQCSLLSNHRFGTYFKFYADEQINKILVSATGKHQVFSLDRTSGEVSVLIDKNGDLTFPNDILPAAKGGYWIADTLNDRFVRIQFNNDERGEIIETISMKLPELGKNKTKPILIRQVGEAQYWAVVRDNGIASTDIVIMDSDLKPIKLISDTELSHPNDLLVLEDKVIVADNGEHRLRVLSLDGKVIQTLGKEQFNQQLDEVSDTKETVSQIKFSAIAFTVILIIGVLIVDRLDKKQQEQDDKASEKDETVKYPIWLGPDEKYKAMYRVMIIVIPIMAGTSVLLLKEVMPGIITLILLMFAPLFLMSIFTLRMFNMQVGIDRDRVTLVDHSGKRATGGFHELYYSRTALMLQDVIVSVGRDGLLLGDDAYRRYIKPRLDFTNERSDWDINRINMRKNSVVYIGIFVITLLMMALAFSFVFFGGNEGSILKALSVFLNIW